ncbi:hypothetical protein HPB52_023855 [Rhipicephalus sanguineus]|uniref:Uncharacterized protein n=1 Tax=Rhipicephalus sanguineus TaxID=34632 RepID=A0A9D4PVM6_RHISA|nr:hypothetical protein HPB52_023855 [Rhipicephalus sanguineus]
MPDRGMLGSGHMTPNHAAMKQYKQLTGALVALVTDTPDDVLAVVAVGFSRAPVSIEEDIGAEFSGCDEMCNEVHKATGCVSDTEDGQIAFEEHALYEADLPITGMLSDADIVEMAVNDADDHADEEEPREVPTTTETRNVLHLLSNKVECSGGDQRLM